MSSITVPGKILIAGEYSVLQGGRALFAAIGPGYEFQFLDSDEAKTATIENAHPESPLGRYAEEAGKSFSFSRVRSSMHPGFGSSTSELIAGVIHDVGRIPETKRLWAWYREQFPQASGGDLAAQIESLRSGRTFLEFDHGNVSPFLDLGIAARVYVFQINPANKLKTHEALRAEIPLLPVQHLDELVFEIKTAFETQQIEKLKAMNAFADKMHSLGLETPLAHGVRLALKQQKNVLAVKGCGAGLNDVFLVAVGEAFSKVADSPNLQALRSVAKAQGLLDLGWLSDLLWQGRPSSSAS